MKKKTKLLTLAAASLLSLGLAAGITVHVMNDEPVHDDVLVDEIGGEDAVGSYNAFPARAIDPSELDAIHGTIGVQLLGEEGDHSVRFVVALSGYQGLESASFTRTVKAGDGTVIMQEKVLGIRQVYSSVASAATIDWGGEAPSATDYPYYMVYTMNKISKEYEYATIEVKFTAEQLANPGTPLTATEKANVKGLIGQTETYDYLNTCLSGHGGSITSCHSGSCKEAFDYLALKVLQSPTGKELPYKVIERLLHQVINVVVHIHNSKDIGRHITEIWYEPGYEVAA